MKTTDTATTDALDVIAAAATRALASELPAGACVIVVIEAACPVHTRREYCFASGCPTPRATTSLLARRRSTGRN